MANRRIRLTQEQYGELTQSRDWCVRHGMSGLQEFYDQELAFQASRRALPEGAHEYKAIDEEEARRGSLYSR